MDSLRIRGLCKEMSEIDTARKKTLSLSPAVTVTPRGSWNAEKTISGSTLDPDQSDVNSEQKEIDDEELSHLELDITKKPLHYTSKFQAEKHHFHLKAAQAKKSVEFIELMTTMSPGNATDMEKFKEMETTSRELHNARKSTSRGYNLRGKNNLMLNGIQYPASNSKMMDLKTRYLKMRQEDTELREHIGLLEAELAEAHAQLKENMSDSHKKRLFPRAVSKKRGNKDLNPVSVCSPKNDVLLAILPKSQARELQTQKSASSELLSLSKKTDEMRTNLSKRAGRKNEKIIGDNFKLPDIKRHSNTPYLDDYSRKTRSCVALQQKEEKDSTHSEEHISLSNPAGKTVTNLTDSEINISQNSKFLPPISNEHHKQEKVKSKSKELKLPDIYAPNRDVLKTCRNTPSEESEKTQKGQIGVPSALAKLKKTKVHPKD